MSPTRVFLKIFLALMFILPGVTVFAQEGETDKPDEYLATPYSLGDQMFSINLGGIIPMFNYDPNTGDINKTRLTAGLSGNIEWSAFVNQYLAIGGNVGGSIMTTPSGDDLLVIPITIVGTFTYQIFPFDIPLFVKTGVNFTKRSPDLFVGPIVQAGTGLYWNMDSNWAFGARATYTWLPVFYGSDSNRTSQNRFGNYLELHFGAVYHF